MISNTYTHTKDCPDRKAAVADRKAHDTLIRARAQRLQLLAHAEWFDEGPVHGPSYNPEANRGHQPAPPYEGVLAENNALPTSPALLELWASRPPAA